MSCLLIILYPLNESGSLQFLEVLEGAAWVYVTFAMFCGRDEITDAVEKGPQGQGVGNSSVVQNHR